jgi:hypothetical protein
MQPTLEDNTHVFIIRIWVEPREINGMRPECRGVLEHVPSHQRCYLNDVHDVGTLILSVLKANGIDLHEG